MIIRKSCLQDLPYLYDICLRTGNAGKDATDLFEDKFMLGSYYAAPYVIHSPEDCFVVVENGQVCGYILSAKHSNDFYAWMSKNWLPQLAENYKNGFVPKSENEKNLLETIMKCERVKLNSWIEEYPAHLHIDILDCMQGKGVGKQLMNTLLEHLKSEKVPGLHLGVDIKNENAVAFYKKMGFSVLEEKDWGYFLGIKLN